MLSAKKSGMHYYQNQMLENYKLELNSLEIDFQIQFLNTKHLKLMFSAFSENSRETNKYCKLH